jgi:4-amino-4-deoxy-L-arabinose transferase-like glycosyltransferase
MDIDLKMTSGVADVPALGTYSLDIHSEPGRAAIILGLIALLFTAWLAFQIPRGTLAQTDELLTAERTREMLMTEPWVVHYNFDPSFEKPPLQYWLSCLTLPRFKNRSTAVRIWPLVYGTFTVIVLGWLSLLVQPHRPWLMPLAAAILVSCPLFSTEACRAMLDIGLTFFTTLAIAFAELARKRPFWWLGVAITCWLASLQKVPLPFLIWLLIVVVRLTDRGERERLRGGTSRLIGSMLLAIALMSAWPLLQVIRYEMPVTSVFHQEVVVWLGPEYLGKRPYLEVPLMLPLAGGAAGLFLLLAPVVVLFSKKKRPDPALREIAIVSLLFIALTVISNFRGVRYVLPIVPCLCLLLALTFCRFLEQGSTIRKRAVVGLAVILFAGFVHSELQIILRQKDLAEEKLIAEKLGELQQAGTKTVLIKATTGSDLMWDSFYLFHGNFRYPVAKYTVDEIRSNSPKPPVIGACVARDFPVIGVVYPNVRVELTRGQFTCWQVVD